MKRISILGLGYIGLPTGIIAAQSGYDVLGFDTNSERVSRINAGDAVVFEPEMQERLWKALTATNFKAYHELQYADCFIIAVPTPFKENKKPELQYVFHAGELIAKRLMPGNLIILESTVPVGTTERLALHLEELSGLKVGIDFFVAHCPERVYPGRIFKEIVENNRVIGGMCQKACELSYLFYSKFTKGFIHITDDKTAEMVKLIENSSRDVQIAFANQVAGMCQDVGLDPFQVIELANKHPRVHILSPGCGVGGHCIAVDPWFLIDTFPQHSSLLRAARHTNDEKPRQVVEQVTERVYYVQSMGVKRPKVLGLGLTFKADIDDVRESPALKIAQMLNGNVDMLEFKAYDSNVSVEDMEQRGLSMLTDLWKAIMWADVIVVLVKHKEFTLLREEAFLNKQVIDPCGLLHDLFHKTMGSFDSIGKTSEKQSGNRLF